MPKAPPLRRIPLATRWKAEAARHDHEVEDMLQEAIAGGEGLVERAAKALGISRGALRRLLERHPAAAELVQELRARNGYTTGRLASRPARRAHPAPPAPPAEPAAAPDPDDDRPPRF